MYTLSGYPSSSLAGYPGLKKILVVPNFFYFAMIKATVLLRTFKALEMVLYPCQNLCLHIIGLQRSGI